MFGPPVTAIRTGFPPQTSQASQASQPSRPLDPGRAAAQRAFFAAALGQGPVAAPKAATEPAAQAPAALAPTAQAGRTPDPSAAPPTRILRPGSLLDIRV